jgi:hypothetical protein
MPTLMSATTQPLSSGTTAHADSARVADNMGAKKNTPLFAPAGMTISLNRKFEQVGEALQQSEGAHHIGSTPLLHRRPHLAVKQQNEGNHHQQQNHEDQDQGGL